MRVDVNKAVMTSHEEQQRVWTQYHEQRPKPTTVSVPSQRASSSSDVENENDSVTVDFLDSETVVVE